MSSIATGLTSEHNRGKSDRKLPTFPVTVTDGWVEGQCPFGRVMIYGHGVDFVLHVVPRVPFIIFVMLPEELREGMTVLGLPARSGEQNFGLNAES